MKKKLKLLQIGPYPPPLGGWSFHIKMFREYLDKKKIFNAVLNIGPNRRIKSDDYVEVYGFWDYLTKLIRFQRKGYLLYHHLNGDSFKGFLLTLTTELTALIYGKKAVLNFHAGLHQRCFNKTDIVLYFMSVMAFKLAGEIICNSEDVRIRIIQNGGKPARISPIPCFSAQYIDFEREIHEPEMTFLQTHDPVITCYLFFREEFEVETLLDGFTRIHKRYPESGIILIGSSEGSEKARQVFKERKLENAVLFSGGKPHHIFLSIIERSDLFLRTHIKDGVCSSVLETLHLGIPVVACDNGIRPKGVVCYRSRNSSDLAEKVVYALERRSEIQQLILQLRDTENIFGRDSIEEELQLLSYYSD